MLNSVLNMERSNLRKNISGHQILGKWTVDQIKEGLEHFKEVNGRYPSAREIDLFEYLPSARSIQRSFGGLEDLRTKLGFDIELINLTKGKIRSEKAKGTYSNAVDAEEVFYNFLIEKIPEIKVHEHKILRPGHICCDFFIYTSNNRGFAIDVFYAQDMFSLAGVLRIKCLRYKELKYKIFFVLVGNKKISQEEIDSLLAKKKSAWPKHIIVLTEDKFKAILSSLV